MSTTELPLIDTQETTTEKLISLFDHSDTVSVSSDLTSSDYEDSDDEDSDDKKDQTHP
jgi:hypothetical protein